MKKIIFIFIISLIPGTVFALETPLKKLSKMQKNGELIKVQSYNARTYLDIKEGRYKKRPIQVDALITYPKKGEGPFPVLIIVHSSGGPALFIDKWFKFNRLAQKPMLRKGIAVMYLDNFSARGVKHTYADQSTVPHWSTYIDAFMALEYLSKDPKVNIKKIGISGWSRGGMISLMASEKRLRDAIVSKDLYFAAAQPRTPDCWSAGMFRNPQPIKETKTWMVLGGADDYTRAEPCVDLGKKFKANGGDIEVTVKKGWGHGFTANYEPEFESDAQTFSKCPPYFTEDDGSPNKESNYGWNDPCIGRGATIGGNMGGVFKRPFIKFWEEHLLDAKKEQEKTRQTDR